MWELMKEVEDGIEACAECDWNGWTGMAVEVAMLGSLPVAVAVGFKISG
jgi:hypothetical protein